MTQEQFDKLPDATMLAVLGRTISPNCKFFLKGKWYVKLNNKIYEYSSLHS